MRLCNVFRFRFWRSVWGLVLLCSITQVAAAQSTESTTEIKRNWYDSVLRLVKGGDGHYYLLRTRDGRFWGFGREGQYRFEILRFDPDFQLVKKVKVRAGGTITDLENAFEVMPGPRGIALLSVRKGAQSGKMELQLCEPEFSGKKVSCECRKLAEFQSYTPRLGRPDVRLAWSPDSSRIAITYRENPNQDRKDNRTACIVLDRNLELVAGPIHPFEESKQDFRVLRQGILDDGRLVFLLRAFKPTGVFATPTAGAFHMLVHDVPNGRTREVRLDSSSRMFMDIQFNFSDPNRIQLAGWWLDSDPENRKAGIYTGELGAGDTLDNLHLNEFEQRMYAEMLPRRLANGAVWFRPSYHNRLLATETGWVYVLHLTGQLFPMIPISHPGATYDNALLSFFFDAQGKLVDDNAMGFCNTARTDYREVFSWHPLVLEGEAFAMVTDFGDIDRVSKSHQANSLLLPLAAEPGSTLRKLRLGPDAENLILAPRLHVREGERNYVFVGRTKKTYQLVQVRF